MDGVIDPEQAWTSGLWLRSKGMDAYKVPLRYLVTHSFISPQKCDRKNRKKRDLTKLNQTK